MGLNLYRGFDSLRLRQKYKKPRKGLFYFRWRRAMRLRASREGVEALRLQAQSRETLQGGVARSDAPGCSDPPSPLEIQKVQATKGAFLFPVETSDAPARIAGGS